MVTVDEDDDATGAPLYQTDYHFHCSVGDDDDGAGVGVRVN